VGEITEKAAEAHEVIWKKVLQAAEELRRSGEEATEKIGEAHEAMRDRLIRSAEEARSNFTEGIPLNRLKRAAATEQSVTVPMEIDPLSQMLKAELEAVRLRSAELDSREADLQARLRKMDKVFEEKGREAQRRGEKVTERAAEVEKEEESILKYWERMLQPKDKSESAKLPFAS
jgi:hypothetical protein